MKSFDLYFRLAVLLTLPSVNLFAAETTDPSTGIDLSHWKLTLPINDDGAYRGHPKEVGVEQVVNGYRDHHFLTDENGTIVFWCPVIGATTEGTDYPRCELREMLEPGNPKKNWTLTGSHTLSARCRVLQVPSYPKVVIGQIHGYSGKARPLVKLQYYKGRIEALVKQSPNKGKDIKLTFENVSLNREINWKISVNEGVLSIEVNGQTREENMMHHDPAWANQTFYFKAGVYPQDHEGDRSEGARVSFSHLVVTHDEK